MPPMTSSNGYRYTSLTAAIADKTSPLRQYFDARFPNLRPIQTEFRLSSGPIVVDAGGANPGTLGAAFDFLVRMSLTPSHTPIVAIAAFAGSTRMLPVLRDVVTDAQQEATAADGGAASDRLIRACWLFALTTEVYRTGGIAPGSPLATLRYRAEITVDLSSTWSRRLQ